MLHSSTQAQALKHLKSSKSSNQPTSLKVSSIGHMCNEKQNKSDEVSILPRKPIGCIKNRNTKQKYNSSNILEFEKEMNKSYWKHINFVVSHGNFIRKLVKHLTPTNTDITDTLKIHKLKNLFIVRIQKENKVFFIVRHCARQFQKYGIFSREYFTADPHCAIINGKICGQTEFEQKLKEILEQETRGKNTTHSSRTIGIYSSCLRRASETAEIISVTISALLNETPNEFQTLKYTDPTIGIVPFCREETNLLGRFDVLNKCSENTMQNIYDAQDVECLR